MTCPNCAYHDKDTKTCARCGAGMVADKTALNELPTPEQQIADHVGASEAAPANAPTGAPVAPPDPPVEVAQVAAPAEVPAAA